MTNIYTTRLRIFLLILLALPLKGSAQEILMAKDNAQITLSMSPFNFNEWSMKGDLESMKKFDLYDLKEFDYKVQFSRPMSITAEYAISNYTTIGINANYFSYNLSEIRDDGFKKLDFNTKGTHIDLHLRGIRYVYETTGSALYILGEIGASVRSIKYNETGGSNDLAYINTFPETRRHGFSTFSYDYGIGAKARIYKTVGVSLEVTRLNLLGRYGLYYIIQPAGRRSKDKIGW